MFECEGTIFRALKHQNPIPALQQQLHMTTVIHHNAPAYPISHVISQVWNPWMKGRGSVFPHWLPMLPMCLPHICSSTCISHLFTMLMLTVTAFQITFLLTFYTCSPYTLPYVYHAYVTCFIVYIVNSSIMFAIFIDLIKKILKMTWGYCVCN